MHKKETKIMRKKHGFKLMTNHSFEVHSS